MQMKFLKATNSTYIINMMYKNMMFRSLGLFTKEHIMETYNLTEKEFNSMIE